MPRTTPTDDEIQRYRTLGYVALPDFLDRTELERWKACWKEAVTRRGHRLLPFGQIPESTRPRPRGLAALVARARRFAGIRPPDDWDNGNRNWAREQTSLRLDHPAYAELIRHSGLGELVSALTGAATIRIYSDRSVTKRPGDEDTYWHLDGPYASYDSRDACIAWMALSEATLDNGCLSFLPGSSRLVPDAGVPRVGGPHGLFGLFPELAEIEPHPQPLPPGGIVFFNPWTVHAAGPNLTSNPREAVSLVFIPDGTGYSGQHHYYHGRDFYDRLRPGDALDDPELFPVLYASRNDTVNGATDFPNPRSTST